MRVLLVLLLVGCVPEEERLRQLQARVALEEVMVREYARLQDSAVAAITARHPDIAPGALLDSLGSVPDSLRASNDRLLLARRDLERLLR